jgi:membrane protease YdiL (CAAX protease family)
MEGVAKPKTPSARAITWGPLLAIIIPTAIYLLSQAVVGLLISIYPALQNWTNDNAETWLKHSLSIQLLFAVLVQAIAFGMLWWFLRLRHATFRTLGLVRPRLRDVGYALAGFAVYLPVLISVTSLIRAVAPRLSIDQKQNIGFDGAAGPALLAVFLCLVLLPPLLEECLFRGFMYLGLKTRLPKAGAFVLTSLLFALVHLQIGNGAPLVWSAAIDTFVLSLVLIYLREATDSLWASIFLHAIKNSLAFLALFVFKIT